MNFGGWPPNDNSGMGDNFNNFGYFRRGIDEATLREIATITGGEYFYATSANELAKVFNELPTYFITREETTEISVFFTAVGAVLAALALLLGLLWRPLP